ncbi:ATP-dependent DNA helicase [Phycicoccus sp. Soil748]|uniref:ATP-dependent DNA helicase n=1 Tax=Phycicoccus sp. Soil748 TaxID=1736397 RepID=UPI00070261B7|nr:ATP-dependent DNA helicase [Phycicoccus sp. Soil748]KRE54995.1 ATP-dependent DNA helicase [Phycicoccus sp. Soil748]
MSTDGQPRARLSAQEVAAALGQPEPTPQQVAVIEAPLSPLLVVAGAGSGKTETMTGRVVWLVANGLVEPDQVLGLTFTRKAATELSERIGARLRLLQSRDVWHPRTDDEETGAEVLGGTPTVSTYHSYAGRLVREHALRLGYESESRLLSEAAAWQYASEVVSAYDGPMEHVPNAESTVTAAVVDLAGEMAEHLVTPAQVREHLEEVLASLAALPPGTSRAKDLPGEARKMRDALRARAGVLPMVERYLDLKRQRDAMDFSDQMALAARLAMTFPDIGAIERQRFGAVLLDEFQDTSAAQLELLRSLFVAEGEPVPVTAVGDPHQSIYGWRGASATTLSAFREVFRDGGATGAPAPVKPLSTSWRNDEAVLDVANAVAGSLRADSAVPVEELSARPGSGPGRVSAARVLTAAQEAALVATWLRDRRTQGAKSAAVLCRKRSQFALVIDALEAEGVPYEVVGLGGLLLTPEVEDITSLLHVVHDPTRGDQLMRLLTGPLCRLGAADLDGLMAWARHQQDLRISAARRAAGDESANGAGDATRATGGATESGPGGGGATVEPVDQAPDSTDRVSIVEAVDDLPPSGWLGRDGQRVSDVALGRLAGLQHAIRRLRSLSSLPLADLVGEAERVLGLDIEVLAREGYTPTAARAHLDAFADVAASFTVSADRPNLGGFLAWLAAALKEERGLDKGYIEASTDAVQVLTVHAAKGLEWDAVAVPGLVEGSFPALSSAVSRVVDDEWAVPTPKARGWVAGLQDGGIPYALRGDAHGLPVLDWRAAEDWKDIDGRVEEFLHAGGEHAVAEERRLAYVAFTRAKTDMLLTAPVWTDGKTPKVTSRFLLEALAGEDLSVQVLEWADMPDPLEPERAENPAAAEVVSVQWPADPLAERRTALADGAMAVQQAIEDYDQRTSRGDGPLEQGLLPLRGERLSVLEELDLLLEERRRLATRGDVAVLLPRHLSASAVVSLAQDPERFASALRRPMPEPPALAARRGTAFHAWVEQHFAKAAMVDILDLPGSADDDPADDAELPVMKEHFLASEWASRTPAEIEIAVETVIDGIAVRGRIDAVFPRPGGGFTVVDWKTGAKPSGEVARARALQLAAYRVAFARLRGLDLEDVDAAFYYAGSGETVFPELPDDTHIAQLLAAVPD